MNWSGKSNRTAVGLLACVLALTVAFTSLCTAPVSAAGTDRVYLFGMDTQEEIGKFDNDHTGAMMELSHGIARQGTNAMKVIPSGEAPETKIAVDIVGDTLDKWIGNDSVDIHVYIPPDMKVVPNSFFLGMADLSDGWAWVGGVFADVDPVLGWNLVEYTLPAEMSGLKPDGTYKLYFAWAHIDEGGAKLPLTEKFYIDGLGLARAALSREDLIERIPAEIKEEVTRLLELDDGALIEAVAKKSFDYLWNEVNPANGLIKDRSTATSPCSIAAVGFGLSAIPVGVERGWITRDEGYDRALTTLKTFADGGVEGKNGFCYHFVDMTRGRRFGDSEISSIDTAIFLAGAITVGRYFEGTEVESLANQLYEAANWQWMLNEGDTLSMGWKPEIGFLSARWNSFNEGLLATLLAIGSHTHPIPASAWDNIFRPVNENYISLPQETLFVYQYPAAWIDFRNKEDRYANYFTNAATATRYNRLFAVMRRFNYSTYDLDVWGLSACDGPAGYKAYGASEGHHDGTVAPLANLGIKAEPGTALGFSHVVHNSNDKNARTGQYVRTNIIGWNNLTEVWATPDLWGDLVLE